MPVDFIADSPKLDFRPTLDFQPDEKPESFTFEEAVAARRPFTFEEAVSTSAQPRRSFTFEELVKDKPKTDRFGGVLIENEKAQPTDRFGGVLISDEEEILSRPAIPAYVTEHGERPDYTGAQLTASDPSLWQRFRNSELGRKLLGTPAVEREGMVGPGTIGLLEIPQKLLQFTSVPPPIANPIRQEIESALARTDLSPRFKGIVRGGAELALNLPLAPIPAFPKTVLAAFGAEYAFHLPEQRQAYKSALERGDLEEATRIATQAVGGGALLAFGAAHQALHSPLPASPEVARAAEIGPATAAAIKATLPEQPFTAGSESPVSGALSPIDLAEQTLDFSNELLPDFIERSKEREVFSQPFAAGRIPVLGRLLDPNARVESYEQQALAAYHAARNGVGPAQASYIGSRFGPEIRNAFEANEVGDLNVAAKSEGQSRKISDVFEELQRNPDAYDLTTEQRRVWNEVLKPILDAKSKLVKKYDLVSTEDANGDPIAHFHRIVTEFPEGKEPLVKRTGQMVGAKIPSQHGRVFTRSEAEGWEKGYKYERDPVNRLVSDIERTYKAIADRRLIDDPVLEGKTTAQFESQLRDTYSDVLASGEMSERSFQQIVENKAAQGRVYQPGFSGTIFDPATAKLLNDALSSGDSQLRRTIATVNDATKALRLGFDLGVGQIQLLPTLFRNPSVWAKANWQALKAMLRPESFSEYLKAHEESAQELAQAGSSVGQLQEYMSGVAPGQVITKIPVLGTAAKAFGRQFQTALDVAKVQLWEAWRNVTPPEERLQVIRAIESQLNVGRMESIGVSGRQALTERVLLLAPSYYRGAVNFVSALAEPGVSGKVARQGLTAFVGGGLALYYAIGKSLGMDDSELLKRLDPSRSDFLQWVTEGADGRKLTLGIGGIHRSLLRLAGNIMRTSIENPGSWKSLSVDKNPISKWLRGHAAVAPELAFSAFHGADFLGNETDLGTISTSLLPLTAQQLIRKPGEPPVTAPELAASFVGLGAYPEPVQKQFIRERDQESEDRYGKSFENLPLSLQLRITKIVQQRPPFNEKTPATERQQEQARKHETERRQRILEALPEEVQAGLKESGTEIIGYKPILTIHGVKLVLTEEQQERFESLLIEEYSKALRINFAMLARVPVNARQKRLTKLLGEAKERAQRRLIRQLEHP